MSAATHSAQARFGAAVPPDFDFSGRVALVTGAKGAIGAATMAALTERGATVIGADAVASDSASVGPLKSGSLAPLDVTSGAAVSAMT